LIMRTDHLFERHYYSRSEFVDGTTEFHRLVGRQIKTGSSLLEIGAGPTNETTGYLATLGRVVGVDITTEVEENVALAEAHVFDGKRLPFPDGHFDACVSNWVVEHVQDPSMHFCEVARVLRPGGIYCFRTPNQWHYFTLGSRLLPHKVHVLIANRLRGVPTGGHDPYPTYYRANTTARVRRLCRQSGLTPLALTAIEKEPSYGRIHPALFYPMFVYERFVNSHNTLEGFRASLLASLRKPDSFERTGGAETHISVGSRANTLTRD
jgi:SAM-dependent methyltransferase